ncbi:MAG: UxaA family hydrolase [Actinomycetota bacterium]|jgi:altronate dehydratase small subunit|uniref:UxaA family hydrolase n=1 Tax=Candidatus Planktophila sp. TaxID=2175601 RepID=UPI0037EC5587|nr:UxaA family hydrolase [Actinomycetota bacterium]
MRKLLILDARDNVAVCLVDLEAGDLIEQDNIKIKVINRIARGHKIASKEIAKGEGIIKYGERMGHAVAPIAVGEHVHVHNILGDRLSTEKP